ncbi:MAG: histone deacetylase [Acidobacteriota bacterium]
MPLRRSLRRLRRRVVPSKLQVVYHDQYNGAFADLPYDALRAERILAFLASEGLVLRRCVHRPEPVWLKALAKVHSADYLDRVHRPETLTSILGQEIGRDLVDRLLDFHRLQTGGTLMATRRARGRGVGINLGGGFHHAHAEHGGGFCVFNDVAVAIADERRRGFDGPVLVVDLDLHDGDGTRDIFRDDPTVHTFSIHASHWDAVDGVETTSLELGSDVDDDHYLEVLGQELPAVFERFEPRLVFYLAGCDPAHDDVLGSWNLSSGAMLERDLLLTRLTRSGLHRTPLVVLLAGGYGHESWRYTARFLSAFERDGRPIEPPSTEEITLKRYRYISSLFTSAELSGGGDNEFGLTEDDLYLPGWAATRETRLLSFYTRHGVELVLERAGFLDRLRDLGFPHPTLEFQLEDPAGQTVRVYGDPNQEDILVELRLTRDRRTLEGMELLSVEWLLMQNPRVEFGPGRTRLPGQQHPGLGMLNDMVALLIAVCDRLHLDGLTFVPSQFHIAVYGKRHLGFLDPETQARFEAMLALFRDTAFEDATRAVAEGRVVDAVTGEVQRWRPEPMVLPVSKRLVRLLEERRLAHAGTEGEPPPFAIRPAEDGSAADSAHSSPSPTAP